MSAESNEPAEPCPGRDFTEAFIAVGSNLDPLSNIPRALRALAASISFQAVSTFYRTPPLKGRDQPRFFNGVWRIRASQSPRALKFDVLRPIEESLGRKRSADRYASRPIDLDLILYGDRVMNEPDLCLPDPDIFTRPFIAVPLLELAPDLILPGEETALSSLPAATNRAGLEPLPDFTAGVKKVIENH